jgi:hypothetical protein
MRDQLSQSSTISNTRTLVIRLLATIARLLIPHSYDRPEQGLRDVICCVQIVPIKPFEFFSAKGNNCDPILEVLLSVKTQLAKIYLQW